MRIIRTLPIDGKVERAIAQVVFVIAGVKVAVLETARRNPAMMSQLGLVRHRGLTYQRLHKLGLNKLMMFVALAFDQETRDLIRR
jgi:hypothetical protein